MSLFTPIWEEQEPHYINELGYEWYVEKDLTEYCNKEGESFPYKHPPINAVVFQVVEVDGDKRKGKDRVVIRASDNEVIYNSTNYEAILHWVDAMRFSLEED